MNKTSSEIPSIKFFSDKEYKEGDTTVTQKNLEGEVNNQLTKQINQYIQKAITFILGTAMGTFLILLWNLNGDVHEITGKNSSPDIIIQTLSQRLDKLEEANIKLVDKNYQLEIDKIKLENAITELKKEKK